MKNKNWLGLIVIAFFNAQVACAQFKKDSSTTNDLRSLLKLKFSLNVGLEWEKKIGKISSLNFFMGPLLGKTVDGFSFSNFSAKWGIVPDIYMEYRNYYNLNFRNNHQKNTFNNSANFLFGRIETYLPVKNQNYFNLVFVQGWGLGRSFSKKMSFDYHLGITEHFYYDKPPHGGFNYIFIEPFLHVSFNYIFN